MSPRHQRPSAPSLFLAALLVGNPGQGWEVGRRMLRRSYDLVNCHSSENTAADDGEILLDASFGTWPRDTFCHAVERGITARNASDGYRIGASFLKLDRKSLAFPGLAFNYRDEKNYDFVYLRRAGGRPGECGHVKDGVVKFAGGITRAGTGHVDGEYNHLEVRTKAGHPHSAWVYFNGVHVADCKTDFPQQAVGGPLLINGYGNIYKFRDVKIFN